MPARGRMRATTMASVSNRSNRPSDPARAGQGGQQTQRTSQTPSAAPAAVPDAEPVGGGAYEVREGDCITSIAKQTGHFWETIWNDPGNAEIKQSRQDPNILLPGDRLTVPPIQTKQEPGESEMVHRFVRRGEPAFLHLQVLDNDKPVKNQPYEMTIDGTTHTGTTDAEGKLNVPIRGDNRAAHLKVGEGEDAHEYDLVLGGVDPIESLRGVQQRLSNLGYRCDENDGVLGPQTQAALRAFQKQNRLEETGRPDDNTRQKLKQKHGC